jgi:hypothetical protein
LLRFAERRAIRDYTLCAGAPLWDN